MMRPALAAMILFCFFYALLAAGPALFENKQLIVEKSGLKLYPRFNKSLKPLTELKEGQILTVLKELKSWKQVQVDETGQKGWIAVEVKWTDSHEGKKYDIVAAPSIAGLVARGWSKDYAARHGADYSLVAEIKERSLNPDRYARFLKGEGK